MANEQTRGLTDFATGTTDTGDGGIRERAREVVDQAKERAGEKIESRFDSTKTRAAETLSGVAAAFKSSSENLRGQNDGASRAIERAAEGVERFASYLQEANVDDVVEQVHEFARRQPAAFIGGAFALGFLASRFIKATSDDTTRRLNSGYTSGYNTSGGYAGDTAYSTDRGYTDTRSSTSRGSGYGNTGDTSGSLGYGAGLSTTAGGDGSVGLTGTDRTGGTDGGSR